jgi:hypothetical protein
MLTFRVCPSTENSWQSSDVGAEGIARPNSRPEAGRISCPERCCDRVMIIGAIGVLSMALAQCQVVLSVQRGRLWFDQVKFELSSGDTARLGGPITEDEARAIRVTALRELAHAFADFSITFSETGDALYQVRVADEVWRYGGAGRSVSLGALGGQGMVSFPVVTGYAIHYAPPSADRSAILDGIGRGIGRAAAHEFAHQLVPDVNIHASRDPASYEYDSAARVAEYYGPIHWDIARPALLKRLGPAFPR